MNRRTYHKEIHRKEQFNSYLQCISYTSSHLLQSHYMFFVQFFIYLWNSEKTTEYRNSRYQMNKEMHEIEEICYSFTENKFL